MADLPRSWNVGFNEAARLCGMTTERLRSLPEQPQETGGHVWQRNGQRIQVAAGNAVWTVHVDDLQESFHE